MQLSQKQKKFSEFFVAIWGSRFDFEHFPKKDDPHSYCIFELTDSEKIGYINV